MRLLRFFQKVFTSRIALAVGVLHLILCIYALTDRPPVIVDIAYESWLFIVLTILDLPSIFFSLVPWFLFAGILRSLGFANPPNKFVQDWMPILIFIICASIQWSLIGYGIEKFWERRKKKNSRLS